MLIQTTRAADDLPQELKEGQRSHTQPYSELHKTQTVTPVAFELCENHVSTQ